ncbi:MAG: hypothetical protein H7X80_05680 [bacterium]|nr:hypothetical protein [Candidatus Kapabacteria bacterium]
MIKSLVVIAALLVTASHVFAQSDETMTVASGGFSRTMLIHWPMDNPPANLPLLFCFHGTGGSSEGIRNQTAFNALADQYGFIVVYPQALRIGNDVQWNVYVDGAPGHGGIANASDAPDDLMFVKEVIASFVSRNGIDTNRVFATGMSNGGFMSYALSILADRQVRAIAPVAANMWGSESFLNTIVGSGTLRTMPVMHVHGTADGVVPYVDSDNQPKSYEEYPLFVPSRVCGSTTYTSVVPIMAGVDKLVFCGPPTEVSLIRITGMGHTWSNGVYQTSREIVRFFGLDLPSAAPDETGGSVRFMSANPVGDIIQLELDEPATIELIASDGSAAYRAHHDRGRVAIDARSMASGSYLLRAHGATASSTFSALVVVVH